MPSVPGFERSAFLFSADSRVSLSQTRIGPRTSERAAARPALTSPKRAACSSSGPIAVGRLVCSEVEPPPHRGPLGYSGFCPGNIASSIPLLGLTGPLHPHEQRRAAESGSESLPRNIGALPARTRHGFGVTLTAGGGWNLLPTLGGDDGALGPCLDEPTEPRQLRRVVRSVRHHERLRDSALRSRSNRPTEVRCYRRERWR